MKSRYVHLKLFTVLAAAVLAIPSQAEILPDGTDATFVYNVMLGTYTLAKPVEFNTPLGKMKLKTVSFHKNGKIRGCVLDKPQVIETPAGKMHKLYEISFYESGKLAHFALTKPQIIETPAGKMNAKVLNYFESGKMQRCILNEPMDIETPAGKIRVDFMISFHESGKIDYCSLAAGGGNPQFIETPAGEMKLSSIYFHESGKIRIVDLAESATIEGKGFSKGDSIGWDNRGKFLGKMKWDNKNGMYVQIQDTDK